MDAKEEIGEHAVHRRPTQQGDPVRGAGNGDRRAQRAGLIMAAIYQRLLDEIEAEGTQVLQAKISLTPMTKLWIAWKTWLAG